ncbi:cilia- and flagella-associated protein HOATZ [Cyprinodon tularosa]|uniref:cilia- and flagella-associated protein HOATZ n=1 Tax=Cyprinodon tularosa TaxID=77115 RepID=UPI0018E2882F|nr:cilia- and flagella-associated protein HOATZ [Cyprinodon tularosa]
MALQSDGEGQLNQPSIVFEGSSPEDVSHARRLWSSLSLLPLPESRLVSADARQSLPVVSRHLLGTSSGPLTGPSGVQREEERRRYEAMDHQRKDILLRAQKETLSAADKPEGKPQEPPEDPETKVEKELIRQLY